MVKLLIVIQVIFSSTVMYANFVTSAERKAIREELDKQLSRSALLLSLCLKISLLHAADGHQACLLSSTLKVPYLPVQ